MSSLLQEEYSAGAVIGSSLIHVSQGLYELFIAAESRT